MPDKRKAHVTKTITYHMSNADRWIVWFSRSVCIMAVALVFVFERPIQNAIDNLWRHLLENPIYNHVTFETQWAVMLNVPVSFCFFMLTKIPLMQR